MLSVSSLPSDAKKSMSNGNLVRFLTNYDDQYKTYIWGISLSELVSVKSVYIDTMHIGVAQNVIGSLRNTGQSRNLKQITIGRVHQKGTVRMMDGVAISSGKHVCAICTPLNTTFI